MELKKLEVLPSQSVGLTPSDIRLIKGTHDREIIGNGKGDRKMAKDPRDS